jgi:DNA-binding transcriptional LysR family regulator
VRTTAVRWQWFSWAAEEVTAPRALAWPTMDLRSLEYFRAVADRGSVSAAALDQSISQPALSRHIAGLERSLGARLFQRTPHGMVLTAAGEKLLGFVSDILTRVARAEEVMKILYAGTPAFQIACMETTAQFVVSPFTAETAAPIVDIRTARPDELYSTLISGTDLVVSTFHPPAHLAAIKLADLPISVQTRPSASSDGSAAALPDAVELAELVGRTIAVPGNGSAVEQTIRSAASANGDPLELTYVSSNGTVAQAIAASGRAIALVLEAPRFGLHRARLTTRGIDVTVPLFAAWPVDHYAADDLAATAESMKSWLGRRTPWRTSI